MSCLDVGDFRSYSEAMAKRGEGIGGRILLLVSSGRVKCRGQEWCPEIQRSALCQIANRLKARGLGLLLGQEWPRCR